MTATNAISQDRIEQRANELRDKLSILREQLAQRIPPEGMGSREAADSKKAIETPKEFAISQAKTTSNTDRPQSLDDIIGQTEAVLQLRLAVTGSQLRDAPFGHVLISGAPGLGKSSLAGVVASELGVPMISTTGMVLRRSSDIIGILANIEGPAVVYIDEAHQMHHSCATVLFQVAEDQAVDMLNGTGPNVVATTKPLPGVVIVVATTHPGKLAQSFRDRLNIQIVMSEYSDDEIAQIVKRYWKARKMQFFRGEDVELAKRARGIPRLALGLARHTLDYVAVNEQTAITTGTVNAACAIQGIDSRGHNDLDRRILSALTGPYAAKAVGLDNLAAFLNVEPSTLELAHEGYLVRQGLVIRTGRGRSATAKAYELVRETS